MKHLVLLTSLSKACCFSEVIVSRHALRVRKLHMKLVKEQGRYCCLVACLGKSALNTAPTLIFLVKFPFILKSVFFFLQHKASHYNTTQWFLFFLYFTKKQTFKGFVIPRNISLCSTLSHSTWLERTGQLPGTYRTQSYIWGTNYEWLLRHRRAVGKKLLSRETSCYCCANGHPGIPAARWQFQPSPAPEMRLV